MIPGLERELDGKNVGDQLEVSVSAADGYGERNEELVFVVDRDSFDEIEELHTGMQLFMSIEEEGADDEADEGEFTDTLVTVTEIGEDSVTVDGNHTLAGIDLHFDVTVRDIRDATEQELEHGHAHGPGSGHDHDDDEEE
jgi:FKBP-type peptidyl-prolyl cis-trans isomerase SlyD